MKNTFKSIWAVFAGMLTIIVLSIVTDLILEKTGIFPPPEQGLFITWMLLLALVYRCVYAVLGSYLTAHLAPQRSVKHVLILGSIGVVVSTIGTVVAWDLSPHWYPIVLTLTSLPCSWLGGKLKINQRTAH